MGEGGTEKVEALEFLDGKDKDPLFLTKCSDDLEELFV